MRPLRLPPSIGEPSTAPKGKYRNQRTELDGRTFDSKAEAKRYSELQLLVRCGQIRELQMQVRYELVPGVRLAGEARAKPAITYVADFVYFDVQAGRLVIEDVKGMATDVYRIKRHLMKALLGLDITEVSRRR